MAFSTLESLNESEIWYASPFGAKVTHGSDARSKSPWFATVPPAQMLNGANVDDSVHVVPLLCVTAETRPCAPPFDQRSCCHTATACVASVGSTATHGSTSAFG